jgi:hypothetical protein
LSSGSHIFLLVCFLPCLDIVAGNSISTSSTFVAILFRQDFGGAFEDVSGDVFRGALGSALGGALGGAFGGRISVAERSGNSNVTALEPAFVFALSFVEELTV